MRRNLIALSLAAALLAGACGANGANSAAGGKSATSEPATSNPTSGGDHKFGTVPSPCGNAATVAKVKPAEAGHGTDKLYIGVGNDREGIRPGLLKELWDATNAFVGWCNAQGGIDGLKLEAVDLDGQVVHVEEAIAKACTDVFALVGGGWAQDNFIFSGKDGADFHKCKLIAIPGFAVSTDFAEATDQVQPIPNSPNIKPVNAYQALVKLYPAKAKKFGVVYGNLPSIVQNKNQTIATAKKVPGFGDFGEVSYDVLSQDWAVLAQQVVNQGLQMISFIGEPGNLSKFSQALKDQGWTGVITADTNQYDDRLIQSSGPAAVDGVTVRSGYHPFEEADRWPATKQLLGILDQYVPHWQRASLLIQAFSAALLFGTVAKQCADEGEISRKCVLKKALAIHQWDGGGLHAATDPGGNRGDSCGLLLVVKDGRFQRLYPKIGSPDDDRDGFSCSKPVTISGDFGAGNRSSSILDG